MASALFGDLQGSISRLKAGGKLYLVEEKPYPAPHRVVVVNDAEQYSISYNDFVHLVSHRMIRLLGTTVYGERSAEVYEYSPPADQSNP